MCDEEFLNALQAEVLRLTELNKEYERQIIVLQRENERITGTNEALRETSPKIEETRSVRRRPYYA